MGGLVGNVGRVNKDLQACRAKLDNKVVNLLRGGSAELIDLEIAQGGELVAVCDLTDAIGVGSGISVVVSHGQSMAPQARLANPPMP